MEKINKRLVEDDTLTDAQRTKLRELMLEATRVQALVADGMSKPLREILQGNVANQADMQAQIDLIGKYGYELAYAAEMANLLKAAVAKGMTPDAIKNATPQFETAAKGTADKSVTLTRSTFDEGLTKQIEMENFALERQRGETMLGEEALIAYRYETDLLTDAKRQNLILSGPEIDAIKRASAAYAAQTIEIMNTREALDFVRDGVKSFVSDLRGGLEQGKNFFSAFGDAVLNVLNRIIDKLIDVALNAAFDGGGGRGVGGFLSSIASIFTKSPGVPIDESGAFAKGGVFTNSIVSSPTLFKFANGTGMMGEAGPEAIMPLKRGANGSLGVQVIGANDNRASARTTPTININNSYVIAGSSTADMQATVRQSAEQTKDQLRREIPQVLSEYQRNGAIA
jgi:hypothetical protein